MALHESKFQGRSTNATGSPISHFSCSFVLYFLLYFTVFLPHSHVATYSHCVFPLATNFYPARVYQHNKVILVFMLYSDETLSRNVLVDCTRIPMKFEFQPTTSLRIYNFAYAHYMFDEFIVTNIHDTQDHTRMYMYVYMYAQSIYVSFRLIPHFI